MKKILAIVLGICLCFTPTVFAYKFPNAYWKIHTNYEQAIKSKNHSDIIKYGRQAIDLMSKENQNVDEVISLIADRAQTVAESYAALGMYEESAEMYKFLIPYAQKKGWDDSVIIAKAYISQYTTNVQLYTDGGGPDYYGGKHEPLSGVYNGTILTSQTREKLVNESAILVYQELGYELVYYVDDALREAEEKGIVIEFALNCPGEGNDIASFESKKYYFKILSDLFSQFPNAKVLLRFGAEFNIWTNMPNPEQYKAAYRYVSDYFEANNPNVAMVWSPSVVSKWGQDMNDYYPGDEYVDWVGVSLYMTKYFIGNPDAKPYEEAYFKTGINSDPVLMMQEVIEKYGNRKPVMISESGTSHCLKTDKLWEDTTDWALRKMKEYLCYIPMVYPQVKFLAYFDHYLNFEIEDYALYDCPELQDEFVNGVKSARFIKGNRTGATMSYRPMWNNMNIDRIVPVSCYAHIYNKTVSNVDYYVDGVIKTSSAEMPYTSYLEMAPGKHTIKAVVTTTDGTKKECQYTVNVAEQGDIGVYVYGKKVKFDQKPVIHHGRTMVPMRAVFESLGAQVVWKSETRTVLSQKGKMIVSLAIDSDVLYKNGVPVYLDVPAMLVNGRTLVPIRAVSEALGAEVVWDGANQKVIIN